MKNGRWGVIAIAICAIVAGCGSSDSTGDDDDDDDGGGGHAGSFPTGAPLAMSLGSLGSCVVYEGGQMWCWGWNQNGQFGTTRDTQFESPTHVFEIDGIRSMALAGDFGCAAVGGGTVHCMGYDHGGTDQTVSVGGQVDSLAVGDGHVCVLLASGTVACWGENGDGQLGDGTPQGREAPAPVPGLSGISAITAAGDRSCAIDSAGALWCWGRRLDGSNDPRLSPEVVAGLAPVTAVTTDDGQSCVLHQDKSTSCWGPGACAAFDIVATCAAPFAADAIQGADQIAVGSAGGCARMGSELHCWGRNDRGDLGDGTLDPSPTPKLVAGLPDVALVGHGHNHVCAVTTGGSVYCWGSNGNGQIGNGTTIDQLTPVEVLARSDPG